MKSPFFPLINVLGTIAVCAFFLRYGGTIAVAAAETGLARRSKDRIHHRSQGRTKRKGGYL
jgi:hypothetical protein